MQKEPKKQNLFFLLGGGLILLSALLLRIIPTLGNNFYFTMDQGNDAVHVREILERHQILWQGPETGIKGLFAGPLWYYFLSLGYLLFRGHPLGGVFLMIILNVGLTGFLIWWLKKKVSLSVAFLIGISLQFFWWFYEGSRYEFNPFPLITLALIIILILSDFLAGRRHRFFVAAIPIGLAFHFEVAGATALFIFYLLISMYAIIKHRLSWQTLMTSLLIILFFFLPHFISEINSHFSQTQTLLRELKEPRGLMSETRWQLVSKEFLTIFVNSLFPQNRIIAIFTAILILALFIKNQTRNLFTQHFAILSWILFLVSWLWFSSNKGWWDWQTIFLPTLLFISFLLMVLNLPQKVGIPIFLFIFIAQTSFFINRYKNELQPSDDPSLLTNEIKTLDWVYQKAAGQGFYAYTYLPSVYDYPYQYLFWWYGRQKYGYLPCEYSSFPNSPDIFVPGKKYYQQPQKTCFNLQFLIIEPDKNSFVQNQWLEQVSQDTQLVEETMVGKIKIEKRLLLKPLSGR